MLKGEAKAAILDSERVLRIKGCICVSWVGDLTRLIMEGAHSLRCSIHPGYTKMHRDLKQHYLWCHLEGGHNRFFISVFELPVSDI